MSATDGRAAGSSPVGPSDDWAAELASLSARVHQDEDAPLDAAGDAAQQALMQRLYAMLDALTGGEGEAGVASILRALAPLEYYGIDAAHRAALDRFPPEEFAAVAARELPAWLARHGDERTLPLEAALYPVTGAAAAFDAFVTETASWSDAERQVAVPTLASWARLDPAWEPLVVALGGEIERPVWEPIPAAWPDDWRAAAEALRDGGRVNVAWSNERDVPANFPRVFALAEIGHGKDWRAVGDLLNIFMRRRREYPAFARALMDLPAARRERILAAFERARPGSADDLRRAAAG